MQSNPTRTCGGCTLCCYTHEIHTNDGLFKKMFAKCEFCVDGVGCAIYNDGRPEGCRTMQCAWLDGLGTDDERPDKTGIVPQTHSSFSAKLLTLAAVHGSSLQSDYAQRLVHEHVRSGGFVSLEDQSGRSEIIVRKGSSLEEKLRTLVGNRRITITALEI